MVPSRPVTAERTKENNSEFAIAAKQAKVIRDALRGLDVGDRYLAGRIVKVARSGVALDPRNGQTTFTSNHQTLEFSRELSCCTSLRGFPNLQAATLGSG